ncbi:hypothetical protein ASA1KI_01910 [Opitutales bacterium ASA1]|uniref:PKD domain-containing protein n=1 Tax=Congregicoccus parvus TaxID=3081749 RepID=UPI002B2B2F15|nr:hypothetical protein ASA1KI_01910 [Opitutales bacterium ASA1]
MKIFDQKHKCSGIENALNTIQVSPVLRQICGKRRRCMLVVTAALAWVAGQAVLGEGLSAADADAAAFAVEVEGAGGSLHDLGFTSDLIETLKAIPLASGGDAYSQLYAGYYPGAHQRWGSDPDRLDVIYDLSREGRHFYSNNSDSKRPFLVGGQIASQPVSRHDANKGWMRTFWTPPAQPHTVFALFRPTGGTSSLDFVLSDTIRARRNGSSSVWVDGYGYGSVPAPDDEWTTVAVRCQHSLGSQGWKVWGNGTVIRNDTPYGSGPGSSDLKIGGTFDQGAPVDIALVLFYAVSLSDAEIVAIEGAIQGVYSEQNQPPQSTITAPSADATITAGQSVNFAGSGVDPDDNTPLSYLWNFGTGSGVSDSTAQNPGDVTFSAAGTYTVTFTVTDALGLADPTPATRMITVEPTPALPVPAGLTVGIATKTTLGASCDPVVEATSYEWRWSVDQSTWQSAATTVESSTTLSGLPSGTTIHVQVRSRNDSGASAWTASVDASTLELHVGPSARDFDGADDLIDWGSFGAMTHVLALSVSAWIYLPEGGNDHEYVDIVGWLDSDDNGWALMLVPDVDLLVWYLNVPSGDGPNVEIDWSGRYSGWHHVLITWDGSLSSGAAQVKAYVDGIQTGVAGGNGIGAIDANSTGRTLRFGRTVWDYTQCRLADVAIWAGTALDGTNAAALYAVGGRAGDIDVQPTFWTRLGDSVVDEQGYAMASVVGTTVVDGPAIALPVNYPPEAFITSPSGNAAITAGQYVNFAGSGSDADGHLPLSYLWKFGAGSGVSDSIAQNPGAVTFNTVGTYLVTLTVTDAMGLAGPSPAARTIMVTPGNTAPTISEVADQTIDEDGSTGALTFAIGDAETAVESLILSAASSNESLVPAANIVFGGSGASRTVTVTPAVSESGTATITITVGDGALTASVAFTLAVNAINDAPDGTITAPSGDVTITAGQSVYFAGGGVDPDDNTPLSYLWSFGVGSGLPDSTSQNPGALPFHVAGTYTVTFTVTDSLGLADATPATRTLIVNAANTAPTISQIGDHTITEGGSMGPIAFAIGDAETAASGLMLDASSSNESLVPPVNIVFGGGGENRTVTVTPVPDENGTATITVSVTDGVLSAAVSFQLTVTAVNRAPEGTMVTPGDDVTIIQGQAVAFAATGTDPDGDTPLSYRWTFGEGSGVADSAQQNPGDVLFEYPGVFTVTLTVTDLLGLDDSTPPHRIVTVIAPDTEPPTAPSDLASSDMSSSGVTLTWNASTDNIGVSAYEVFRDGVSVGTTSATSMYIAGTAPGASHVLTVRACDAAGNWSTASPGLQVTLPPEDSLSVVLLLPENETAFTRSSPIHVEASVTAVGLTVSRVEFLLDGVEVGKVLSAPYAVTLSDVSLGEHVLRARAIGSVGDPAESQPVVVFVVADLPYLADFETEEGYVNGPLDGQLGWTTLGQVEIDDAQASSGSRSVTLLSGPTRAEAHQSIVSLSGQSVVFVDVAAKPVAAEDLADASRIATGAALISALRIGTEAELYVWDGSSEGVGAWKASGRRFAVDHEGRATDWLNLTIRQDFNSRTWDLYVDGVLIRYDVGFPLDEDDHLSRVAFAGPAAATGHFDALYAGTDNPLFEDNDRDGIDDAYEAVSWMDRARNDRDEDLDGDGLTNIQEYLLGTRANRSDTDGDRLPDGWEVQYGFNPLQPPPFGGEWYAYPDSDGDGLTDNLEYYYGTNPLLADTDGDGTPDSWEVYNGLDPLVWDSHTDPDGDGRPNVEEYTLGSNPRDFFNGESPIVAYLGDESVSDGTTLIRAVVTHADGTVWANAPVTLSITSEGGLIASNGTDDFQPGTLAIRSDAEGRVFALVRSNLPLEQASSLTTRIRALAGNQPVEATKWHSLLSDGVFYAALRFGSAKPVAQSRAGWILYETPDARIFRWKEGESQELLPSPAFNRPPAISWIDNEGNVAGNVSNWTTPTPTGNGTMYYSAGAIWRKNSTLPTVYEGGEYFTVWVLNGWNAWASYDRSGTRIAHFSRNGTVVSLVSNYFEVFEGDPLYPFYHQPIDGWAGGPHRATYEMGAFKIDGGESVVVGLPVGSDFSANIQDVSSSGVMVGWVHISTQPEQGQWVVGNQPVNFDPQSINDFGVVAGFTWEGDGTKRALWWFEGETHDLGSGVPITINATHDIVGIDEFDEPVLWRNTAPGGAIPGEYETLYLNRRVPAGWRIKALVGMDDAGAILAQGDYTDPSGTSVPTEVDQMVLLVPTQMAVDASREGIIEIGDTTSESAPFRFWSNDDDDMAAADGDDIPGRPLNKADYNNAVVDSVRDLVDFFPVYLDIKQLLGVLPHTTAGITYKLKQADGALNFVYTNKTRAQAFDYQKQILATGFGPAFTEAAGEATTEQITAGGATLNTAFLDRIKNNDGGVILVEGRVATTAPLRLVVEKNGTEIAEVAVNIRISPVEEMFRHVNLTGVPKNYDNTNPSLPETPEATRTGTPTNWPDTQTNGKYFVFLHGYNVDAQKARGWQAEVFKRLHVLGSKARFVGVTWHGATGLDYHRAVFHAFQTGDALAGALSFTGNADVTIAGHSLGNMVVSHAIQAGGLSPARYYMINAATPIEAYAVGDVGPNESANMTELAWRTYDTRLYMANWHTLFAGTSDNRKNLTWKALFKDVGPRAHNFYSEEEDVVTDADSNTSASIMATLLNQGFDVSTGAWKAQELVKGVDWTTSLVSAFMIRGQAGWGFNLDDWYTKTNPPGPPGQGGVPVKHRLEPGETTSITNEELKTKPFFDHFLESALVSATASTASDKAGEATVRYDLFARGISAMSNAVAANFMTSMDPRNYPMHTDGKAASNGAFPTPGSKWRHSDFKAVALPYVYPMYEEMISRGALK